MSAQNQYEVDENEIMERYARGEISNKEMWREIWNLQDDYRSAAEEADEELYRDKIKRWC